MANVTRLKNVEVTNTEKKSSNIAEILKRNEQAEVIHRDNLVIL